jgi:hypothetical protein
VVLASFLFHSYRISGGRWTKVEIADTPTDKEEWQHFAENFRLKMAKDIHDMASHLKNFGVELFQARRVGGEGIRGSGKFVQGGELPSENGKGYSRHG